MPGLSLLSRLPPDLRPPRPLVATVIVAIAVQMAFRLAVPLSFEFLIDDVVAHGDVVLLRDALAVLLAAWALQAVLSLVQDRCAALAGLHVVDRLRVRMFDLLARLPARRARDLDPGDVMARFTDDLARLERAAVQTVYVVGFSALNIVLSIVFLFVLDWRLASVNLAGLVLGFLLPRTVGRSAHRLLVRRRRAEGEVLSAVSENLGTLDVVRAFNLHEARLAGFRERLANLRARALAAYLGSSLVARSGGQASYFVQVATMGLATWLVLQGDLTVGVLVAFVALLQNLVAGTSHLSTALPEVLDASSAAERVREILALEDEIEDRDDLPSAPPIREALELVDVGFEYEPGRTALGRVGLRLEPGRWTALVGPSGAGKSTLLQLILRFDDPTSGRILLDGRDVREWSRSSVRSRIGVVPQESRLFHATLRENVRAGSLGADDAAVEAAARGAGVHEAIVAMPDGYETLVDPHGGRLSGGQRQRIALARALVRQPDLLVLDEATSALDPETERGILGTLREIARTHAVLLVTHRLQTITDADEIVVLDRGRIVERGPHEDLLSRDGVYHRLWQKQAGFDIAPDGRSARISPERLRSVPLFAELGDARLEELATMFESHYLPAERTLFHKGDPGDRFWVIADGLVEIRPTEVDRTQFRRVLLDTGDFLGELALIDDAPRNATVRTRLPTLFLGLPRDRFFRLLDEEESLRRQVEKTAAARRRRAADLE